MEVHITLKDIPETLVLCWSSLSKEELKIYLRYWIGQYFYDINIK